MLKDVFPSQPSLSRRTAVCNKIPVSSRSISKLNGPMIACPHCQQQMQYLPQMASCLVACPGCGGRFRMPADDDAPAYRQTSYRGRVQQYRHKRPTASPTVIALGISTAILLILLIVAYGMLTS